MWKVLTDFAGYTQWHPDLSFVDVPTEVRPGTVLRARLSTGSEIDGEYDFTVLHYEAPRRLAREGGIPGVVTGDHSFLLDPHDGGTRYTESETFTGPAAVETVEPNRAQMEKNSASYGRALKERLESGH
ncbi:MULTISPECIES: SRPBCC domain-containing protein [Streptomyces]|uniref:SRPBCC domain-containing protein n=1 Tax=Streptomyces TaxID=1883 RepID=UPI00225368F7|nr:SRPBCC domain-containing protein [Streptomyces sp. NBC_01275]MCX4765950.1 SRPBCC domain-containing protein [Streptomyces sp. NBC_01275]